jgi:hypothetical protein
MGKMKKRLAVIGAVSVLAIGGGIAWAAWNADATGNASATSGSAEGNLTLQATVTGQLVPGATRDLSITVTNSNEFPVKLNAVSLTGITVTPGDQGCTGANSGIELVQNGVGVASIPLTDKSVDAKTGGTAGTTVLSFPGAIKMTNNSDDTCQSKDFSFAFSVDGESAAT